MEEKSEPTSVSVRQFVTARTQELIAISSRITSPGNGKEKSYTPFKHIPKNLRRRAVSHNVKRMPFRFRPKVSETGKKDGKGDPLSFVSSNKVKKSGSRKHRRRKGNLLLEFNRRQRTVKWLETHIWHAKRFHIEPKWNYKIPIAPCDKGRRALYRSTKNYVTMQDISFTALLELEGDFGDICSGFGSVAPKEVNKLSIGAVMFKTGERFGKLRIYKKGAYPFGYIGEVDFQWLKRRGESVCAVWLWVHPAIRQEIVKELLLVFDLNLENSLTSSGEGLAGGMKIDEIKLLPKNFKDRNQWINREKGIVLRDLEGEVNRLRLSGPETLSVLKDVLRTTLPGMAKEVVESNPECVLKVFLGDEDLERQQLLWSLLDNFQDFPAYSILPLIVRDPRVFLPQSRAKILLDAHEDSDVDDDVTQMDETSSKEAQSVEAMETDDKIINGGDADSSEVGELLSKFISIVSNPLEVVHIRLNLVKEKMTDEEFCKRRAGLLIPGSEIDLGREENQVPIILVHRPASSNAGNFHDGGFDIILPAGWTMAFWIAFAYRAVRVAGLRDSISCAFETGNLHSSYFLPPDSESGAAEKACSENAKREEYFKLAPAKRPNLIKLGCCSPFTQDYSGLLAFWNNDTTENPHPFPYFVLRDQDKLSLLATNMKTKYWSKLVQNLSSIENIHQCLIGVRIELLGRGNPNDGAIICIPTVSDVENYSSERKVSETPIHTEPIQNDTLKHKERADLRQKHQKVLAYLRKKRKKLRRASKKCDCDETIVTNKALLQHYDSQKLSQVYNQNMSSMWLIPEVKYLETYGNMSRKPMGFTIYGGNEYSHGKCSALGYVSAVALLEFAKNALASKSLGKFVLARNWTDSFVYRAAKLKILKL